MLRSIANLIDEVDAELDPTVRQELSREIEKQILFDATWGSTLEYTKLFYGSQPWMRGRSLPQLRDLRRTRLGSRAILEG